MKQEKEIVVKNVEPFSVGLEVWNKHQGVFPFKRVAIYLYAPDEEKDDSTDLVEPETMDDIGLEFNNSENTYYPEIVAVGEGCDYKDVLKVGQKVFLSSAVIQRGMFELIKLENCFYLVIDEYNILRTID